MIPERLQVCYGRVGAGKLHLLKGLGLEQMDDWEKLPQAGQ